MRRVEVEEVPAAKSSFSKRATLSPRSAASRAMPAPIMPPPMIATSKSCLLRRAKVDVLINLFLLLSDRTTLYRLSGHLIGINATAYVPVPAPGLSSQPRITMQHLFV